MSEPLGLYKALVDISFNLYNFLSLSTNPHTKNVFPKQTSRDGFDETVSSPNYYYNLKKKIGFFFLINIFCVLFDWYELGWWVITRWRWSMMACKSSMWISMDLKKVIFLTHVYFFFQVIYVWICIKLSYYSSQKIKKKIELFFYFFFVGFSINLADFVFQVSTVLTTWNFFTGFLINPWFR